MANLNQTDLDVRNQLTACKFSILSKKFADDLKYGRSCTVKDRENLLLLNIYLEILQCYRVLTDEVLSTGTILFSGDPDSVIRFKVGNTYISSNFTLVEGDEEDYPALVLNINAYQEDFVASWDEVSLSMDIEGPCNESDSLTIEVISGSVDSTLTGMIEGTCGITEDDNCFTEDEIQTIIGKIEDLADICFQPIGFTYTEE